ncbi:MAG TPA: serine protease, partial [Candidatus Babeliales bacterium]|nr:serine protease [Candidatus Babeliales bacterium]
MIKRSKLILLLSCSIFINANDDYIPDTNDPLLLRLLQQQCAFETATTRQPWRPIQEEAHDTVVQIFSQIAEMDLLQPYKTPAQYGCRGSGFFIDNEGTLVTNAHVVDQAIGIWVQIPSMGKRPLDAYVISICPDRDIALLHLSDRSIALIREVLGEIPFLSL